MADKLVAGHVLRGASIVRVPPLPSLDAPSSLSLDVARWAGKPARLARMDRLCAIALVAADGALVDAGLSPLDPVWPGDRTGIVLGTAYGCYATNEAYDRGARANAPSPRLFAYTLPSSAAGEISIHASLLGPVSTQVGGLTAGLDALREAVRHFDADRADRMLVVAADVVTPTLARLHRGVATHDVACALLLERGAGKGATVSRFIAGDAARAASVCLDLLGGERVTLDDDLLSAAPLVALLTGARGVIVATDPVGQATALAL